MIDFLNSFKSLIKLEHIRTDNNVFKLHYKFTVILLIVFSILLTSKQYFGDPISCDVDYDKRDIINTYCWIHGTYIVKRTLNQNILPGIGNEFEAKKWDKFNIASRQSLEYGPNDVIVWQQYYQWVCIVFSFQALLFYVPRYLWKTWEGGGIGLLVKDLCGPLVTPSWNLETKNNLIKYLLSGRNSHTLYAVRYCTCEVLNFINVVAQISLMDAFLMGEFSFYGVTVATVKNLNPMNRFFPKVTKCAYYRYGPSGTLTNIDALCVLPLNVLNEKLFLILWIWLYLLSAITGIALIYRIIVICAPRLRAYLLIGHSRFIGCKKAHVIVNELSYGDFFVLDQVGKNVNPIIFYELVEGIHEFMRANKKIYTSCPSSIIEI